MLRFVVTRLVLAAVALLGISLIVFVAMRMVPGGFATAMLGPQGAQQPELVAQLDERYGLNDPLIVQYGVWLKNALQGDFGESLGTHASISHELARRAGVTIELALLATLVSVGLGVPLGVLAASKRGSPADAGIRGYQYTTRITGGKRDAVMKSLREQQIGCAVYYPIPLHLQKCFAYLGYQAGDLPESERAAAEVLSLPIYSELPASHLERVAMGLSTVLGNQQTLPFRSAASQRRAA